MKIGGGKKTGGVGTDTYVKGTGDKSQAKKSESGGKASSGDSVDISLKGRDLNRAKAMLDSVPDVRGEMVVKLKTDIALGNYNVDAGKVAEKMIERAIRDSIYSKK